MLGPLVVLAILSIVGGWVGIPTALGSKGSHFDEFLAPVFHSASAEHQQAAEGASPEQTSESAEPETGHSTELLFTGISVAAGLLGLFLAWLLYSRRTDLPDRIADSVHGLYSAVANKYWVDEMYATIFVGPLIVLSRVVFWRGVDQTVIDGTLNGGAAGARELSDGVRHMQSGNLRSYAGWVAIGAAAVIAYMVWVGTR